MYLEIRNWTLEISCQFPISNFLDRCVNHLQTIRLLKPKKYFPDVG